MRLDPISRAQVWAQLITAKLRAPDELRALDGLAPFTSAQIAQLDHFFPPSGAGGGGDASGSGPDDGSGNSGFGDGPGDGGAGQKSLTGQSMRAIAASPWTAGPQFGNDRAPEMSVAGAALGLLD
jgi:hypothetical protein